MSKSTAYSRLVIFFHIKNRSLAISWSWKWKMCYERVEVARPTSTTRLKMEDACNLCNVIEFFYWRKVTKTKKEGPLVLSNSKWHSHNCVKTHSPIYVDIQILPPLRGGIDQQGVGCDRSILWLEPHQKQQIFRWHKIGEINLLVFRV
jgi:hypothetical protein